VAFIDAHQRMNSAAPISVGFIGLNQSPRQQLRFESYFRMPEPDVQPIQRKTT